MTETERSAELQLRDHVLPEPDAAGVDVDEIGIGIVADAAQLQRARRTAQVVQLHPRYADVDRLADHVQAARRHPRAGAAACAQHRVRGGRAVPGDDVERLIRFEGPAQLADQIARGALLEVRDGLSGRTLGDLTLPGLDERVAWKVSQGAGLLAEETRATVFELPV